MSTVKTAISVPEPLFRAADSLARKLKVSRSELYARAMTAYLGRAAGRAIREKLDEVYAGEATEEERAFVEFSKRCIRKVWERENE